MIKEKAIKAALIDWLYSKGHVDDAVLINEMVVANWARRADLALANGRLHGFEIKSAFDSLKRLPGQIESFQKHFDKVTVVAASKFIPEILKCYPEEVGVLEVCLRAGRVMFRQARSGRISEVRDRQIIASLITKAELEKLLRQEGVYFQSGTSRKELLPFVDYLPVKRLKLFALACIKQRYQETFNAFDNARRITGSLGSLSLLSRAENNRISLAAVPELPCSAFRSIDSANYKSVDFSVFGEECGALAEVVPHTVLTKKKYQIKSS
ncbi:sce7726 family protein [Pseudomonas kermanshahensis]|uniref:sce7726 family protein n=1 Tax=Pseudomonas kermanshahensis TaxID=2745482 RepID=UPI0023DC12ED|nr:sce7726 family protein [Pseudomonas kermanshahensis]WEL58020.1 sce7726 family protein [Pseudomonas kermanshahensis]